MWSCGLWLHQAAHSQSFPDPHYSLQTGPASWCWVSQPPLPWSPSCGHPPETVIGDSAPHLWGSSAACAVWAALPVSPGGAAPVAPVRGAAPGALAEAAPALEENCPVKSQTHVRCHQRGKFMTADHFKWYFRLNMLIIERLSHSSESNIDDHYTDLFNHQVSRNLLNNIFDIYAWQACMWFISVKIGKMKQAI